MKPKFNYTNFIAFSLLLAGCNQGVTNAQLDEQKKIVQELQTKIDKLEAKLFFSDTVKDWDKVAYLTPGADGYSVVKFDLGYLTIALDDIKPYANGSKVTLRFGNTLSSTITGLTATLEWGKVDKNGLPDNETTKSREVKFKESLRSGAWTQANVVLEGVLPTELGYVRVSKLDHTGIVLDRR